MNMSKRIGTAGETAVVKFLVEHGFPHAERRALAGAEDKGDITGTPGIAWEVKAGEHARNASHRVIEQWMEDTERERENARADIGVLVVQSRGIGAARVGLWRAYVSVETLGIIGTWRYGFVCWWLDDVVTLLRSKGYGEPL